MAGRHTRNKCADRQCDLLGSLRTVSVFTNRTWVFDGQVDSAAGFLKQMASFFGGRLFTLVVEEAILAVFITWLGFNSMAVKLIAQVVVIVLNYIISKLIVFKK